MTATASAPAAISASTIGCTIARAVAATVTAMRSAPASVGALQPKAASFAVHGVRRSICARTTPSRNSVARCGNSSGRNRKRAGRSFSSARLPEQRDDAVGVRAGELSIDDLHALEWQPGWRSAIRLDHEGARVLLDHLHGLARTRTDESSETIALAVVSIQREKYAAISA